jgi:hypothetical protein
MFPLGWAVQALAACPPPPAGFSAPPETRQQVDLVRELEQPWQAGGEIVLVCGSDGAPLAGRLTRPPKSAAGEQARRTGNFALAQKLNLAHKDEAHSLWPPPEPEQLALLGRFALSDAGAVWLREVADDSLRLFNQGYLEYDRALWARAVKSGRLPKLSRLLTGKLTETGRFANDIQIFKFFGYAGPGAMAQPGAIGLGDAGLKCQFPSGGELVDPHAILSHEFGHSRYGDPESAGTLLGEARTVERYENPVRARNGYEPRTVYFQRTPQGGLEPGKGSLVDRLLRLEKEQGISISDLHSVNRYHCDCLDRLSIVLDCGQRQPPPSEADDEPVWGRDCRLGWGPGPGLSPKAGPPESPAAR